jgi:hypothetical protein
MPTREENELLVSLAQQSAMLRRTLDNLNGVWSDEASRTLYNRHLSSQLAHDEDMLQALQTQTQLHFEGERAMDATNQQIAEAGIAHRHLNEHLLYAQQQLSEAERKRRDSLSLQQEVRDMLAKVQRLMQEAKRLEHV